jgi:transposase
MSPADLLPRLARDHLSVTDLVLTSGLIGVAIASTAPTSPCPVCDRLSDRVHGRYRRTLADLPAGGRRLLLVVSLRKFVCRSAGCPRHIFCERLPELAAPHARSTDRLAGLHRLIGLALGGEPGSRLAEELAAPTSGDTILRRVKATPEAAEPHYRFVGIDDFAFRKGRTYGTILIDLERGRVIDIFDGRDGSAVEAWLKAHPGVEVITRDRWLAYANAATAGAPQATQVADRWHLIRNLREMVERLFEQHASALDAVLEPAPDTTGVSGVEPGPTPAPASELPPPSSPGVSARRQRRQNRFEEVRRLRAGGAGVRQIARDLRMSRGTVRSYLRREQCPDWNPGVPRATRLDGFRELVDAFIGEGGRTAAELYRRLRGRGCRSSYDAVRRFFRRRLGAAGIDRVRASRIRPPRPRRPSARQLSFEFVRRAEERSEAEAERMAGVNAIPALGEPLRLAAEFLGMNRGPARTLLSEWLARAEAGGSGIVRSFAESLRTDEAAVRAGLTTGWSNGPVEGQVNRLKTIKRSMYGRAGFRLLRARVKYKP